MTGNELVGAVDDGKRHLSVQLGAICCYSTRNKYRNRSITIIDGIIRDSRNSDEVGQRKSCNPNGNDAE